MLNKPSRRWFERPEVLSPPVRPPVEPPAPAVPDLYTRCPSCAGLLYDATLAAALFVCGTCGHHFPIAPDARIRSLCDADSLTEHDADIIAFDALGFVDNKPYPARLMSTRRAVGRNDAFMACSGQIYGVPVEVGSFDFRFMGGSMGSAVGEAITRLYERAAERRVPALVVSASGGARMQEGVLSLMQMAKTTAALARLRDDAGMPYISILTHPTTGGVAASFAMLGDIIVAEPRALIGFAGPRVIKETIGQALPDGFQTAEYLLEHGMVDAIVERGRLRDTLGRLLRQLLGLPSLPNDLRSATTPPAPTRSA